MLEFDLSAIDIVLLIAVLTLFVLYMSGRSGATKPAKSTSRYEPNINQERETETQSYRKENPENQRPWTTSTEQTQTTWQNCIHEFGYLKNLPRNTPIPDECFGCPKAIQCLFPNE